eukprot:763841-Hanusia_phi.AAC.3
MEGMDHTRANESSRSSSRSSSDMAAEGERGERGRAGDGQEEPNGFLHHPLPRFFITYPYETHKSSVDGRGLNHSIGYPTLSCCLAMISSPDAP